MPCSITNCLNLLNYDHSILKNWQNAFKIKCANSNQISIDMFSKHR